MLLPNTCSRVVGFCTRREVCARKLRDLVRVTIAYAVCVLKLDLNVSAEIAVKIYNSTTNLLNSGSAQCILGGLLYRIG